MQEIQIGDDISSIGFWIKLVLIVITFYLTKTVRGFEKDIRRLSNKNEILANTIEQLDKRYSAHVGWHKGKGDYDYKK